MATRLTLEQVDNVVRRSLNRSGSWAVPEIYRQQYIHHLSQCPNDTHFDVDIDQKTLTCKEDQCWVEIPINFNKLGAFDLSAYEHHINNSKYSQAHFEARSRRLRLADLPARPSTSTSTSASQNPDLVCTPLDIKPVRPTTTPAASHRRALASDELPEGSPVKRQRPSLADVSNSTPTRVSATTPTLDRLNAVLRAQQGQPQPVAGPSTPRQAMHHTTVNSIEREIARIQGIDLADVPDYICDLEEDQSEGYDSPDAANYQILTGVGQRTADLIAARRDIILGNAPVSTPRTFRHLPSPRMSQEHRRPPSAAAGALRQAITAAGNLVHGALPTVSADYDEEMRRYDEGIVRADEEMNEFFNQAAAADDLFDENADVDGAWAKLGLTKNKRVLPNMGDTQLMAHQVIGVSWMVEQEKSKAFGGILADEMGLGKTVQTIATMVMNESTDPNEKTTLVVAPLALLGQWEAEIKEKLDKNYFSILIYHGQTKKDIKSVKQLLEFDVVITTYQTVVNEWFDLEGMIANAKRAASDAGEPKKWEDYQNWDKPKGFLLDCPFYRIVLDEAQLIRNRRTKAARAAFELNGLLRWCLTGTPITNKLEDAFSLLRFCEIKPWHDWDRFSQNCLIGRKRAVDTGARRLQVILRPHLLRRKKDSLLNGKPILQLPKRTVELRSLEFTDEERSIYTAVETQSQIQFNKYLKAGTVLKNYAHVLVMLTRLRQICFHAALIGETFDEAYAERDKMADLERAVSLIGEDGVARLKKARAELAVERAEAERDGVMDEFELEDCPICLEPPSTTDSGALITRCGHVFCKPCMHEVLDAIGQEEAEEEGPRLRPDQRPCPTCRGPISKQEVFGLVSFEPTAEDVDRLVRGRKLLGSPAQTPPFTVKEEGKGKGKGKAPIEVITLDDSDSEDEDGGSASQGRARVPHQPNRAVIQDSEEDEEVDQLDEDPTPPSVLKKLTAREQARQAAKWRADQEPSTKMMWVLAEIRRLQREAPDDKIIISSGFTTALDMVEDHLTGEGIRIARYQGNMSSTEREQSIKVLMKSKKCHILLMSIRSGGVGLNLTRANRWISLDLAWSNAVEEQAFARIHRIGQHKEVQVDRLTIDKTVEQRIQELQEHKQQLADASLGEGTGAKVGRLSVAQLAGLFGLTATGERIE